MAWAKPELRSRRVATNLQDAKTVQAILRHSDVTTTLGIYAHSMSEDRLAAQDDMLAAMMTKSNAVN